MEYVKCACGCGKEMLGLDSRGRKRRYLRSHFRRSLKIDVEEFERLYVEEKWSLKELAKHYQVTRSGLSVLAKRLGIRRTLAETHKLQGRTQVGAGNPAWRGGRKKKQRDGYIFVYAPDHPRVLARVSKHPGKRISKYIAEHILIWEAAHGRLLPLDWIIHHINGVTDDNKACNFLAMPKKNHSPSLSIKEVQLRLRQVEGELKALQSQLKLEAVAKAASG